MIVICSAIFWSGLFFLFFGGFQFLKSFVPNLAGEFVEYIFSMFFLSLLIMLIFSTGIILYTGLFQSREATYLLTTPASPDRIFAYKFVEAIGFSSWAFLLLGSPLMVSFGIVEDASWGFYADLPRLLPRLRPDPREPRRDRRDPGGDPPAPPAEDGPRDRGRPGPRSAWPTSAIRLWKTPGDVLTTDWVDGLLGKLEFSRHPLWPSRWMSAGLVASVRGDWSTGLFYLGVIAGHAGLAYLIAAVVARDLYRVAYGRVQGGRSSRRRFGWYGLDAAFHRVFFFLPMPIRLLILKDLRTFRRDPAQWSQFLIFFGLLAFYFVNIRRLSYDVTKPYWRNLISFLNLSVTALILSTFTSRFIFPLALAGGAELLGPRAPAVEAGRRSSGASSRSPSGISLVATEALVVLSDLMLRMGPGMILLHVGMVAVLCFGLSGISVGLGARLPNLKEDDPSKIAAGFGGTLNLLVSLVFICAIVMALAVPCHLYYAGQDNPEFVGMTLSEAQFRFWLGVAIASSLVVGLVGTILPLRIGIKAFQRMEL